MYPVECVTVVTNRGGTAGVYMIFIPVLDNVFVEGGFFVSNHFTKTSENQRKIV